LRAVARSAPCGPAPFRAAFSTTVLKAGVREKLWKGEAPGAEDPYTQPPPSSSPITIEEPSEPRRMTKRERYIAASPLAVPPLRKEAATEAQAETDPMYEPAKTLDDLVEPAPLKEWWDQPGHWSYVSEFKGFAPKEKTESAAVVEVYLRRAVGECLALREAGKLSDLVLGKQKWNPPPPQYHENLVIEVSDGVGSVSNASEIVEGIEKSLEKRTAPKAWKKVLGCQHEPATKMVAEWDPVWKTIKLDDELKFGIRKRLFQLTGNYIPDARLGACTTVKHLLTFSTQQPKPTKLAKEIELKNLFDDLTNVRTQSTKIKTIQKETEVGRWKIIEEELEKRGLPATGFKDLPGHKESKRLRGVE